MAVEILTPVPVADLIARRRHGRYYATDGYLSSDEVAHAWPVVWHYDTVVRANGVDTKRASATGTYGTTTWTEYRAGDVQRVADAIADGTAVLEPGWRRDTEQGQELLHQARREERRRRARALAFRSAASLLVVLACLGFVVFAATH
ncbi:hypothetical protein [Micromonospora deserti]|uniref:Uncharacterized protein n=1 Tax=Micromonospora deserti TaxID=2070366 RepID=A0A2W2D7U0_9ACTN|nr:hypothetical protein [Micromonospora deserti]PZG01505.1 hypothetical protein C1I99_06745 [Micromonospora deserti]